MDWLTLINTLINVIIDQAPSIGANEMKSILLCLPLTELRFNEHEHTFDWTGHQGVHIFSFFSSCFQFIFLCVHFALVCYLKRFFFCVGFLWCCFTFNFIHVQNIKSNNFQRCTPFSTHTGSFNFDLTDKHPKCTHSHSFNSDCRISHFSTFFLHQKV